jgi:hypothetical protein
VTCKVKRKKKIKCTVQFTAAVGAKRATARLLRHGETVALGDAPVHDGKARIPLVISTENEPSGRYTLAIRVLDVNGETTTARRKVTIG